MTAPQLAPGTVVAQKYRLAAILGYSGSAATYQAAGADGREVVIKIFDPAMRQRADIMAAIEQTYAATNAMPQEVAAPLLDAGYDAATGAPFSVGERIPFPSLAQMVAQRPLQPEDAARVAGVVASLLDQAHARGLFHHALKPTNVFVGFAQGHGVRVTDFGAGLPRAAVPTPEGYVLAAPWLAPEQVQGTTPAGAAADVFALGLLLFYALTGRSYWRSCQAGAVDLAAWQQELVSPRTPPSARALQLGAILNSMYDGVLGCALSADPGQRYRSAGELVQAFDALAGARPPESQATMAFPTSALGLPGGGGDYPPPPRPTGGYAPAPAAGQPAQMAAQGYGHQQSQAYAQHPQQGYAAPPPPQQAQPALGTAQYPWGTAQAQEMLQHGQQRGMPPQPAPSQPQAGAYVSTHSAPAQAQPQTSPLDETAAGRVLNPVPAPTRAPTNRLAPILVGVVAVLLLGGGAGAWVVMGKRSRSDPGQATSAAASAVAPPASAPADTASAAPAESASAAPAADPAASASAAPPADAPTASASADADAGAPATESTISCDPECDEIKVDDKAIELGKPVDLGPGKHTLAVAKAGYVAMKETVVLKPGQKLEKVFKLRAQAAGPSTASASTGPVKPCGKFLKRGAGCK